MIGQIPFLLRQSRMARVHTKDDTATLTASELDRTLIKGDTSGGAFTLTLPAASYDMEGFNALVVNTGGNNLTVKVAAGYGGAGGGSDEITLAQGQMARVLCDGENWYALHHSAAA